MHETYVNLAKYIDHLGRTPWLPERVAALLIPPPPPPAQPPPSAPGQLEQLTEEEEPEDLGHPDLPEIIESPEEAGPAILEVTLAPQEPMEVQQTPQQLDTHPEGSIESLASATTEVAPILGLPVVQVQDTETAEFNRDQLKRFERELQQYRLEPDDIAGEEVWKPEESEVSTTTE